MADKPNVSVIVGQPTGLKYSDPDALALRVGTAILGRGFTGRLMANVRDKEGLTYGIGAGLANDSLVDGEWRITANFAPQLLDKGMDSTKRELDSWYKDGVTAQELDRVKSALIGTFKVGMATTDGLVERVAGFGAPRLRRELARRVSEARRGADAPGGECSDQEAPQARRDDGDQGGQRADSAESRLSETAAVTRRYVTRL